MYVCMNVLLMYVCMYVCMFVCRYRRGFLDRLTEHIVVTALTWAVLSPLIIFQSLLSVRDSNFSSSSSSSSSSPTSVHPTATETFMPVLVVLALGFLASMVFALAAKSSYQVIVCMYVYICMNVCTA